MVDENQFFSLSNSAVIAAPEAGELCMREQGGYINCIHCLFTFKGICARLEKSPERAISLARIRTVCQSGKCVNVRHSQEARPSDKLYCNVPATPACREHPDNADGRSQQIG